MDQLNNSYGTDVAIDVLPCTNMLSVGVDISRLGLMIMKGQPKVLPNISRPRVELEETVKASSLVITLYSSTRPRDRSHYETFYSYHQAISACRARYGNTFCSQSIGQNYTLNCTSSSLFDGMDQPKDANKFDINDQNVNDCINQLRKDLNVPMNS